MQEHSMAGADSCSNVAQGAVADAVRGELIDQRIEELAAPLEIRCANHRRG
jgi:hypothetical protein